ncbi:MAG TPA: NB-ARC domain-containing protein [Anaerolineaceae bacterium]|nr:NB-ARC domain-containing protein [Anaerolineaceae bacterium]HQH86118.1 NB-ARC domain-containing protein [Anaerolineaceae bacterium]
MIYDRRQFHIRGFCDAQNPAQGNGQLAAETINVLGVLGWVIHKWCLRNYGKIFVRQILVEHTLLPPKKISGFPLTQNLPMDDTFSSQNVPPHNPKAFGELLSSLIRVALPQDKPKGGYKKRFAEILDIPYDRLLQWTRGNISNDRNGRSLTPDLFIKLVKELWKCGALTTAEQVQAFARCAGTYKEGDIWLSYDALLNDDWFRQLVAPAVSEESAPLSDHWVLRSDVLSGVIGKIKTRLGKVVVLQGKPGTGKSTLMAQLAHDKDVQVHFSNRIYRANPNERTALAILRDWYQQCFGITAAWGDDEYKLAQDLKRKHQNEFILLLLDGVEKVDQVGPLMVQDPSKGVVVIATRFPQVCRDLDPDAEIIEMPGFTPAEAEEYLRLVWNVTSLDDQAALAYQAVVAWVNGNPLALHYAAHRASQIGWPALLALLQEPPTGPLPTDMLDEIYRPLELGYQALPADLQRAFCQIGALPELREYDLDVFRSLWNLPANQTKNRLDQLVNQFGALIPHQVESQTIWRIHQQTYFFARDIFERKLSPKDKAAARGWLGRYHRQPAQKVFSQQFNRSMPVMTAVDLVSLVQSYPRLHIQSKLRSLLFPQNWDVITQNTPALSSQEYGIAERLRQGQKNWWGVSLTLYCAMLISLLLTGLAFVSAALARPLIALFLIISILVAIFMIAYTIYNLFSLRAWHWIYTIIANQGNIPNEYPSRKKSKFRFRTLLYFWPAIIAFLYLGILTYLAVR